MLDSTKKLAEFSSRIVFDELPEGVIEKAKLCFLDALGCASAGSLFSISKIVIKMVRESGGRPEATVIGEAAKIPALNAVFSNVFMASSSGISDTHFESSCHPGRAVVFACLAAGEMCNSTGKDLITALVVGYETATRICMALGPLSVYRRGFHSSMLGLPFGCAASTGKILKLDEDQMVHAFGLVDVYEPRLKAKALKVSPSFFLKYARSAQNGFYAALLAQRGVEGFTKVFDDEDGFYKIFSDRYDVGALTENIGDTFTIEDICFKKYATCHHIEPALDAFFDLSGEFSPEEIDHIVVRVPPVCYDTINAPEIIPSNAISAMFSGRYLLAVAVLKKKLFTNYRIYDYLDTMRTSSEVEEMARKVKILPDPVLEVIYPGIWAASIEVKTKRGNVTNRVDLDPKKNQAGRADAENKFLKITDSTMKKGHSRKILETVKNLERIKDINEIARLLKDGVSPHNRRR